MHTTPRDWPRKLVRTLILPIALIVILGCEIWDIYDPSDPSGIKADRARWTQYALESTSRAGSDAYMATFNALGTLETELQIAQTEEAAYDAAQQPADAPAPAPPEPPVAPASSPPVITRVDFPTGIPANGTRFTGWASFTDPEGDVNWMIMEVVKSQTMKGFEDDPRKGMQGSPTDGRCKFQIWCYVKQEITMRLTLVDAAGNRSNSMDFSFECY